MANWLGEIWDNIKNWFSDLYKKTAQWSSDVWPSFLKFIAELPEKNREMALARN